MQQILQAINNSGFLPIAHSNYCVDAAAQVQLYAINPTGLSLEIGEKASVELILLHGGAADVPVTIRLGRGAVLKMTELALGSSSVSTNVNHAEGSVSKVVTVSMSQSKILYDMQLCGENTYSEMYTLQMGAEKDNNSIKINMSHMAPKCSSKSLSKCVASGESNLAFEGLVYVAHDAQQTAAEQNCRCIELSNSAHIAAQPQLEIYADDVKCSHGATMGQVDNDAILYMRQRGLSESQARRVQMEGFVVDIIDHCDFESLRDSLNILVAEKLEEM